MKSSTIYSTNKGNIYLYDIGNKYTLIVHPELKKAYQNNPNADSYYQNKYNYLKKYGFFRDIDLFSFETKVDECSVKRNLYEINQIVFEVTDFCNLRCEYCSLGELYSFGKKKRKNINENSAINFLKYIFSIKKSGSDLRISFFGGEPLLNFKFIERIVQLSNDLNKDKKLFLSYNITTNATILNKYIHFFVKHNFYILISLDGDKTGNTYRKYSKDNAPSFDDVIRNIDMIKELYPSFFSKNIDFNSVLNDKNSVSIINNFIYDRYHKIPRISELNSTYVNKNKKDVFDNIFRSRSKSEIEYLEKKSNFQLKERLMIQQEARSFLKNYSINFQIYNPAYLIYDKLIPFPTGSCLAFQKKIFFNTNNQLLPCEKVNSVYSLGNSEEDISINIAEIAKKYTLYYTEIAKMCKECYFAHACPICLMTLENLDKLGTKDFICPGFLDSEKFKHKLSRIFSFLEEEATSFGKIL